MGFCAVDDAKDGLNRAITLVVRLSDSIVDEIDNAPTHTYFHHYRTVNTFLDQCSLRLGLYLQSKGYRYLTIPASQSVGGYQSRYSHKKAACLAGLGTIGKSALFLHHRYGPRVRLATVLIDCEFEVQNHRPRFLCGDCDLCVKACPALALTGNGWENLSDSPRLIDPAACSSYMKDKFQLIGRGAVCGICMQVCPLYEGYHNN